MHLRETILCQIQGCYPTLTLCRDISLQRLLHTVKQLQYLWVLLQHLYTMTRTDLEMFFSERGELQPWQVLAFALIFDPETTKPSFKTSLWLVSIYVAASSLSRSTILGQNLHISLFILWNCLSSLTWLANIRDIYYWVLCCRENNQRSEEY